MEFQEYIEGLSRELETMEKIDDGAVFQAFAPYFSDKNILKKAIEPGLFYYDFCVFERFLKGTAFEEYLFVLVDMVKKAEKFDKVGLTYLFKKSADDISSALQNVNAINWLENGDIKLRNDIFLKSSFRFIGEIIEGTLKPYIKFFYGLSLICDKISPEKFKQKSLGYTVEQLKKYDEAFIFLYQKILFDINIGQWRNISYHHTYKSDKDTSIEVFYGAKKQHNKLLSNDELRQLLMTLNIVGYFHKIAFTIIHYDNQDYYPSNNNQVSQDTIIAQIIETSFKYGISVSSIEVQNNKLLLKMKSRDDRSLSDNNIAKLFNIIKVISNQNIYAEIEFNSKTLRTISVDNEKVSVFRWK